MKIPFWKMHGAGNDFVLVDDRAQTFPVGDRAWLAAQGQRRTGVGCEGFILIQPAASANFRMRFFNPDGSEVEMCGNGARCVARLAHELGVAPARMTFDTVAGLLAADVKGDRVRLGMTAPRDWRLNQTLVADGTPLAYHFVNSGVPHVVVVAPTLDACEVVRLGRAIRHHADFAPAGTNANFIQVIGADTLRIRTYERGVEDETLACGTGIVAAALLAAKTGRVKAPVTVVAASGDRLTVDFALSADGAERVTLEGPAVHVFQGELRYPNTAS